MKKAAIVLVLLVLLTLTACGVSRPTDAQCESAWDMMEVEDDNAGLIIASTIMNREQLPNTVGERLKDCLEGGWRWDD